MTNTKFGVLVHGAGWVSTQHLAAYAANPQTEVLAISSRSAESARRRATEIGLQDVAVYDDLDDFNGENFSPPISSERTVLNEFSAYSQQITVENVNASNFEQVVANHSSNFVRVTVQIYLNSKPISSANWLRARY